MEAKAHASPEWLMGCRMPASRCRDDQQDHQSERGSGRGQACQKGNVCAERGACHLGIERTCLVSVLLLVVLMAAQGFGQVCAQTLAPGEHSLFLEQVAETRQYLVFVPRRAHEGESMPLLVSLHDSGSSASAHRLETGFDSLAQEAGFIVVYPEGWRPKRKATATWNAGGCCGPAGERGVDDVDFITRMLDDLQSRLPIDKKRIYAAGLGNGAMLVHRLAMQLPQRFAAFAAVGGTAPQDDIASDAAVALLQIHSKDDPHFLYGGGEGKLPGLGKQAVALASVNKVFYRWSRVSACEEYPNVRRDVFGALGTVTAGQRGALYFHPGCRDGKEVALWQLDGLGHRWPGAWTPDGDGQPPRKSVDVIDATQEVWGFVSRFRLGGLESFQNRPADLAGALERAVPVGIDLQPSAVPAQGLER